MWISACLLLRLLSWLSELKPPLLGQHLLWFSVIYSTLMLSLHISHWVWHIIHSSHTPMLSLRVTECYQTELVLRKVWLHVDRERRTQKAHALDKSIAVCNVFEGCGTCQKHLVLRQVKTQWICYLLLSQHLRGGNGLIVLFQHVIKTCKCQSWKKQLLFSMR